MNKCLVCDFHSSGKCMLTRKPALYIGCDDMQIRGKLVFGDDIAIWQEYVYRLTLEIQIAEAYIYLIKRGQ